MTDTKEITLATAQSRVLTLPGRPRFMLDADLAEFYGTRTDLIGLAVKRNPDRFPEDFSFRLTEEEFAALITQNALSNVSSGRGGSRHLPLAFTQAGALALSGVLKTPRAAEVSVMVFRAFATILDHSKELALLRFFNRRLKVHVLNAKPRWSRIQRLHQEAGYEAESIRHQLGLSLSELGEAWMAMEDCGLTPEYWRAPGRLLRQALAEMDGEAVHG